MFSRMEEVAHGIFLCRVCKTTKTTEMAAPVMRVGASGMSSILFIGSFLLLLLATVVFDAYPWLQATLTWAVLYSMYLVYFGLAYTNIKRKMYV